MTQTIEQTETPAPFVLREDYVDTRGIDRADLLAALYNGAGQARGMGIFQAVAGEMTRETALEALKQGDDHARNFPNTVYLGDPKIYFDYLRGRCLKVDLTDADQFNPRLYDRDHGRGAAARIVAALRSK